MGKEVNVLRVSMVCLVLVAVLLLLAVVALGVGSAGYSLQQIIQALFYDESGPVRVVVYNLRLPRLIMAVEVGACLAVAGALLQAVMRNPLADRSWDYRRLCRCGYCGNDDSTVVSDFGFISAAFCFWRCGFGLCTYLFAGLARWD